MDSFPMGKVTLMNKISLVYPCYNAQKMLQLQMSIWAGYPDLVRKLLEIVIVDDCSSFPTVADIVRNGPLLPLLDLKVLRICEDIPWNQHGARNLGAHVANSRWLLMLDIKHTVNSQSMFNLMKADLDTDFFYTFPCFRIEEDGSRWMEDRDGRPIKPHPNTYLVTKQKFWESGGYDEDYCGTYGGDGPFMRGLERVAKREYLPDFYITRWSPWIISDSMSHGGLRPIRDQGKTAYLNSRTAKVSSGKVYPINPMRFKWERVL